MSLAAQDDAEVDCVYDDVFTNVIGTDADAGIGTNIGIFSRSGSTSTIGRGTGTDTITPCFTVTRVPITPPRCSLKQSLLILATAALILMAYPKR